MAWISFTKINRDTILLMFFFLFSLLSNLLPRYMDGIVPDTIGLFDTLCQISITIPYFIRKFYKKKKIFKKKLSDYTTTDYIIFVLMIIINLIDFTIFLSYDKSLDLMHSYYIRYTLNLILLLFFSKYSLSKSNFYIHHLIGLIIVIVGGSVDDYHKYEEFFNDDDYNFNWKHIILILLESMTESILVTYKKYLMDVKYISLYVVCFIFNFVNLIYIGILFILKQFNYRIFELDNTRLNLFEFDFENDLNVISGFIISIICNTIYFYFYYQISYFFTPSHMILPFFIYIIITDIENAIEEKEGFTHFSSIILGTLIILFGFFICLEIIELNFCGLNKNLRNKIASRGSEQAKEDFLGIESLMDNKEEKREKEGEGEAEGAIELIPGYLIDINKRGSKNKASLTTSTTL